MAKWTAAKREAYFKSHPENFADPSNQDYPIEDGGDVEDAWDLAGHASNPDAVRTKIKSLAKRLGLSASLPKTAKEDGSSDTKERSMSKNDHAPMSGTHSHPHPAFGSQGGDETHSHEHSHDNDANHNHSHADDAGDTSDTSDASQDRSVQAMTPQDFSLYLPITRTDATQRRVFGQATIEQPDAYGTIFGFYPEAWKKWRGNIREQHDPKKAVGKALEVLPDEQRRAIDVDLKVSRGAQDTWLKIEDGVLSGLSASIIPDEEYGTDIRKWPRKEYEGKPYPYLPRYSVVELSLVDNPATPGCNIQIVRALDGASLATDVLDNSEPEPITPETPAQPTQERAGARISSSTQSGLHDARNDALMSAMKVMGICGCDQCSAASKVLDPDQDGDLDLLGMYDPDGDSGGTQDGGDDDFMASKMQDRMIAILERSLAPVYTRQQHFLAQLARANTDYTSVKEQLSALTSTVEQLATSNQPPSLDRVLTELSVVKDQVERIAAQPMPGGPLLNGARPAEKTLATDPYRTQRANPQEVLERMQQLGALDTIDKQVAAAALAAQPVRGPYSR